MFSMTPFGPRTTSSTCTGPGKEVKSTSTWRASSATLATAWAPAFVNVSTAAGLTSYTTSDTPDLSRLSAMPWPILPRPMNPTFTI